MESLRESMLHQEIQRKIELARKLEKNGKHDEASRKYMEASAIYRRVAMVAPREKAEEFFSRASQYENVGKTMSQGPALKIELLVILANKEVRGGRFRDELKESRSPLRLGGLVGGLLSLMPFPQLAPYVQFPVQRCEPGVRANGARSICTRPAAATNGRISSHAQRG